MYAIVRTGGKQYRVEEGRTVIVERLPVEEGAAVELDNVLLIEDDGQVTVGSPTIEGARVLTEVEANGRDKKIIVFKYRAKVRTRKKTGHRQHFTRLAITEILRPGQESKAAKPKRRARGKAAVKPAEEAVAETPVEAAAEATAAKATRPKTGTAAKAAPKRATRRKAATPTGKTARKPAAAKAKTPTAKTAAPKRKTARKKKDGDAAGSPKATASAESITAGKAEKKPARRRKATPPKATPPKAARQDKDNEE
ncbi:MAG: 50S ribosomal protein L21 [Chloroflexi bacterium]|nr:50S ribosomal protein L21 [Chloroflexota bacterium]